MCGRYQFSVEQCEEIQRIAEMIDQKYGAGAWQPGEIRPTAKAPRAADRQKRHGGGSHVLGLSDGGAAGDQRQSGDCG